jgi:hypothetical protein
VKEPTRWDVTRSPERMVEALAERDEVAPSNRTIVIRIE